MAEYASYVIATGDIVAIGSYPCPMDGQSSLIILEDGISELTHWVNHETGQFIPYTDEGKRLRGQIRRYGVVWNAKAEALVDARPLEAVKEDAWRLIKKRRDVAFFARAVSSTGVAYSITKDKDNLGDRIKSLEAAIAVGAASSATTTAWRDFDNVEHALAISGYYLLAAEMGARGQAIYEHSWALDAQVRAAASKEAVGVINLEAGWP